MTKLHALLVAVFLLVATCVNAKLKLGAPSSTLAKVTKHRGGSALDISSLDWRHFVAGGICSACSHGVTTPIDVVKTKIQTSPEKYSQGIVSATHDIVKSEGIMFLLAGLGPTIVGYGLQGSIKFGLYESFKSIFKKSLPDQVFLRLLLASVVAGAVSSIVLCPLEETRIKMVGDPSWSKENLVSGVVRSVREDGPFSSFSGLGAMLAKQVPNTIAKQVSFDLIAQSMYKLYDMLHLDSTVLGRTIDRKWLISVAAACSASILASLSSQPGDVMLTETYKGNSGKEKKWNNFLTSDETRARKAGLLEVTRSIYAQNGIGGFFVGTKARLAHVIAIITVQLTMYDALKSALGLPVTGSH